MAINAPTTTTTETPNEHRTREQQERPYRLARAIATFRFADGSGWPSYAR